MDSIWTTEETIKLMTALRAYPVLYDPGNKEYFKSANCQTRVEALIELSNSFGRTVDEIKAKVKGVRTQYMREKAKQATNSDGVCISKQWFGVNIMSYMENTQPFLRKPSILSAVVSNVASTFNSSFIQFYMSKYVQHTCTVAQFLKCIMFFLFIGRDI